MKQEYLLKLGFSLLIDLISSATKRIYYSYPSIHVEVADALLRVANSNVDIRVLIDASEKNFRNGYGNIAAVDILKGKGVQINELSNNLVSFLIVDELGYYIFPESRIFEEDGKSINAVLMSPIEVIKIIAHFFPPKSESEKNDLMQITANIAIDYKTQVNELLTNIDSSKEGQIVKPLNEIKFEETRKCLIANPPIEPDLKRKINIYTAKIQFVEMKFPGVNFDVIKIPLPTEAIPIKDEKLLHLLETRLRLFDNLRTNPNNSLWKIKALKKKLDSIRNDYTIPLTSRSKRIVLINQKEKLKEELESLSKSVDSFKKDVEMLFKKEIESARNGLIENLTSFLKANPVENVKNSDVKDYVEYIVAGIKFPAPDSLKNEIKMEYYFFDITWEDLQNQEILKELKEKNILDLSEFEDIVEIKKAFAIRK
jgi:hypothetical protein